MTTVNVLSPECNAILFELSQCGEMLTNVARSPDGESYCSLEADSPLLRLGSDASAIIKILSQLGCKVCEAVRELRHKMDHHLVDFYTQLQNKHDEEISLFHQQKQLVSLDPSLPQYFSQPCRPPLHACQSSTFSKPPKSHKTVVREAAARAQDALSSWMHLEIESVLHLTRCTRGAAYIRQEGFLHCIASINAGQHLPKDIGITAGSTLGVVVQSCLGVNLTNTRFGSSSEALPPLQKSRFAQALKVRNAVIMPFVNSSNYCVGCLVVADKCDGVVQRFSTTDEFGVWAATVAFRCVLQRYPVSLMNPTSSQSARFIDALATQSVLPAILVEKISELTKKYDVHAFLAGSCDAINVEELPQVQQTQVVVRTGTLDALQRDIGYLQRNVLTDEDAFEAAAPYVANIDELWRKAIENVTKYRSELEGKDAVIAKHQLQSRELEFEVRQLQRDYNQLKMDVERVKQVVPEHLKEVYEKQIPCASPKGTPNGRRPTAPRFVSTKPLKHND